MIKYVRSIFLAGIVLLFLTGGARALSAPKNVWVTENGATQNYFTSADTVSAFLEEKEIALAKSDRLNVPLDEEIIPNYITKIEITRGIHVDIDIDGTKETLDIPAGTYAGRLVKQLETERNAKFVYDGKVAEQLQDGQKLKLRSVNEYEVITTEEIPFDTVREPDDQLEKDKIQLAQHGVIGAKEIVTRVTQVHGQAADEKIIKETVVTEPVTRIIKQGTKEAPAEPVQPVQPVVAEGSSDEPDMNIVQTFTMNASAYSADEACTGKKPGHPGYGITASGMKAQHGVVAVDPSVIPLGTKLYVEGYGYAIAGDTGGSIKGKKIDLFYESYQDAVNFGRRNVVVYVLAD